jgi:hypothetical protein
MCRDGDDIEVPYEPLSRTSHKTKDKLTDLERSLEDLFSRLGATLLFAVPAG